MSPASPSLTANTDDATFDQAKKTNPYAFLSKPVEKRDLKRALELAANLYTEKQESAPEKKEEVPPPLSDRLFVYDGDKRVKILFDAILYIQAERNYCRIVTQAKEYLLSMPMKSLETELPPPFVSAYPSLVHRQPEAGGRDR